jgi:hypothetical protein
MSKPNKWARLSLVLMAVVFAGCKAAPAPSAGFADASLMKPDPTIPFNKYWRKPDVAWNHYDTIYIASKKPDETIGASPTFRLLPW